MRYSSPLVLYCLQNENNDNDINIANWINIDTYLYLEVLVYRHCSSVPDPQYGRCQGGLWTQVQELPQMIM